MIWKEISRSVDEPSLLQIIESSTIGWPNKGQLIEIKANLVGTHLTVVRKNGFLKNKQTKPNKQTAVRMCFILNSVKAINYAGLGLVQQKEQTFCRGKT